MVIIHNLAININKRHSMSNITLHSANFVIIEFLVINMKQSIIRRDIEVESRDDEVTRVGKDDF